MKDRCLCYHEERPRRLSVGGHHLHNIFTIRNITDANAVRNAAESVLSIVLPIHASRLVKGLRRPKILLLWECLSSGLKRQRPCVD